MDNKIRNISSLRKNKAVSVEDYSFEDEVEKDIEKLGKCLDLTRQESINMAKDFYRKYPMLMEWVRSPEQLLKK